MTVSLQGEDPIVVPGSGLTAHISEAFHKTRAPLVGVSVLFTTTEAPIRRAQVAWRIESGNIDASWHPLEGRRYDTETSKYVEESIPGWKVRLDSIDDQNAGGTPTAITITLTRSPDATQ